MARNMGSALGRGIGAGLTTFGQLMMEKRLREEQAAAEEDRRRQALADQMTLLAERDRLNQAAADQDFERSYPVMDITGAPASIKQMFPGALPGTDYSGVSGATPMGVGPGIVPTMTAPVSPVRANTQMGNMILGQMLAQPQQVSPESFTTWNTPYGLVYGTQGAGGDSPKGVIRPQAGGSGLDLPKVMADVDKYVDGAYGYSGTENVKGAYKVNDKGDRYFDPFSQDIINDRGGSLFDATQMFGGYASDIPGKIKARTRELAQIAFERGEPVVVDRLAEQAFSDVIKEEAPRLRAGGVKDVDSVLKEQGFFKKDGQWVKNKSKWFDEPMARAEMANYLRDNAENGVISTASLIAYLQDELGITNVDEFLSGGKPKFDVAKAQSSLLEDY